MLPIKTRHGPLPEPIVTVVRRIDSIHFESDTRARSGERVAFDRMGLSPPSIRTEFRSQQRH